MENTRRLTILERYQEMIAVPVLLALVIWVARYWHSAHFGLYEDDWTIVPNAVTMTFPKLLSFVQSYIVHLYGHARPLSDSMIYLLSFLGWQIERLQGIYWVGFGVVTFNAILFYLLVKRVGDQTWALLSALTYCLFSADTTQAFLTHSLGLQPSLTLLLLAMHFYLAKKRVCSYFLVLLILFSYESPFLLFCAAPLFKTWDKRRGKELVLHVGILSAMLIAVVLFRSAVGEERVTDVGFPQILITPALHMIQGPVVSLATYLYRPLQAIRSLSMEVIIATGIAFIVFMVVFLRLRIQPAPDFHSIVVDLKSKSLFFSLPENMRTLGRLALAGMAMLILAYPLTFTVRAYAITGRDTRVHFAAVVGAALFLGSIVTAVLRIAHASGKRWWVLTPLAAFLALLVGYGFVVQKDYEIAWKTQQDFWKNVLPLAADMTDGTVIIVEPNRAPARLQIGANTWTTPRLLQEIYQFPKDWQRPPRVYLLEPDKVSQLVSDKGLLNLNQSTSFISSSEFLEVDSSQVIWIEMKEEQFTRRLTPLILNGKEFQLKQPSSPKPIFPIGLLYDFLFLSN